MESDAPFAVEAEEAAHLRSTQDGITALGDVGDNRPGSPRDASTEETPLIPQEQRQGVVSLTTALKDDDVSDDEDESIHKPWLGGKEFADKPRWRRPSVWWMIPPLLPFTIAMGGMAVPRVNLILSLICRDYFAEQSSGNPNFTYLPVVFGEDNAQCQIPAVQRRVARFQLYLMLISGVLAAIINPQLGNWSDQYGRKRIMAMSALGFLISEIFTLAVAIKAEDAPLYLLLIGAVFDGLAGSLTGSLALIHSYATDCSPPERRNVIFGYFHGVLFTGIAIGPYLFGFIIKQTGKVTIVFYAVLGCHLFFFLMLVFVIPESVSKKRQLLAREKYRAVVQKDGRLAAWYHVKPSKLFLPLAILYPKVENPNIPSAKRRSITRGVRRNLVLLACIDFLMFGVAMGTMQILVIYAEYMYHWGNYESSIFVSLVNSTRVITLLVFLPLLTRMFRGPESQNQGNTGADTLDLMIIRLSILFDLLGYIGYITARADIPMLLSGMVTALGGMGPPSLQSAITKHVPADRTGQILGASGLLHALARILAPLLFNSIYERTIGRFDQAVFVCLASFFGLSFILSWFVRAQQYLPQGFDSKVELTEETTAEQAAL